METYLMCMIMCTMLLGRVRRLVSVGVIMVTKIVMIVMIVMFMCSVVGMVVTVV